MNWGKSIVFAFVLFALFIGVLVAICLKQDIPLVAAGYYQQELVYQQQLDRINNTEQLPEKPTITVVDRSVEIKFSRLPDIVGGDLELFRPSDEKLDRHFNLNPSSEGKQRIDISDLHGGMYKAKMRWSMEGKDYYLESVIYL